LSSGSLIDPLVKTPRAAAIYARISSDIAGTDAGVQRQVEDCRKFADSLGWPVAGEYVDNDISATNAVSGDEPDVAHLGDVNHGQELTPTRSDAG
jgi:hypothetical protein